MAKDNANKKRSTASTKGKPLTAKQRLFIQEYLVDLNATQSALRAGYSGAKAKNASEFLKVPHIKEAVDKELAKRSKRVEITQDRVLERLAEIAFAPLEDEDKIKLLKKINIKGADMIKSLELIGRHLGMFNDKLSLSGGVDITLLEQARERAKQQ